MSYGVITMSDIEIHGNTKKKGLYRISCNFSHCTDTDTDTNDHVTEMSQLLSLSLCLWVYVSVLSTVNAHLN